MSDSMNTNDSSAAPEAPRKISLADAVKNKLAQKKQAQHDAKGGVQQRAGNAAVMRNQNNKKPNNQRRRTGGS